MKILERNGSLTHTTQAFEDVTGLWFCRVHPTKPIDGTGIKFAVHVPRQSFTVGVWLFCRWEFIMLCWLPWSHTARANRRRREGRG